VASISLLSIFPASRPPKYVPDELSAEDIMSERSEASQRGMEPGTASNVDSRIASTIGIRRTADTGYARKDTGRASTLIGRHRSGGLLRR
jgi:hypothetical protein